MRYHLAILMGVALLSVASPISAQTESPAESAGRETVSESPGHNQAVHGHSHDSYFHDHVLEIGLAPGLAYLPASSSFAFGLHLHLVGVIADTRWGLGLGVERLFDEHGHTTFSAVVQLRLIAGWGVIVAPGVTLEDADWTMPRPSVHFETAYEFMFGAFHLGPSLEVAVDPEEVHITLGLHMAVGV